MKRTFKHIFYDNWKKHAVLEDNYAFVIKSLPDLHKSQFPLHKVQPFIENLTYKKVNDWDSKGLISAYRHTKETGWRVFSWVDIIKLCIISDLRKDGYEIEQIKNIFDRLEAQTFANKTFCALEYFIILCVSGEKILLVIDADDVFFLTEKEVVLSHFSLDKSASKVTILPFFSYTEKMRDEEEIAYRPHSLAGGLFRQPDIVPTAKEEHILDLIKKRDYSKVTVTKREGNIYTIKAGSYHNGDFSDKDIIEAVHKRDFQTVKIALKNGKIISLECEETIKV